MNFEWYSMMLCLIGVVAIVFLVNKKRSKKTKIIIWGTTLMIVIAPLLSLSASKIYALIEEDGWAGIALVSILFPVIFLIGLITLLIGVFWKEHA